MHHPAEASPLGKSSAYVSHYAPELLFPIPRETKWRELGLDGQNLPYHGVDVWNCYELSWLLPSGKPVVALAEFRIPADSPNIIESKSFKLYLNSLNQSVFASREALLECLRRDLSATAGRPVEVQLADIETQGQIGRLPGHCIDGLEIRVEQYDAPRPEWLQSSAQVGSEACFHSHLLRSNCPVTGQPDWGSLAVSYRGDRRLDEASFLAYLISFREHADFHEQCVERIYRDLLQLLAPEELLVFARYVRRGGLDINPYRSLKPVAVENIRLLRQ